MRMAMQSGEKVCLNVYQDPRNQRSKITNQAATRLGRRKGREGFMNLIYCEKGGEISILVNTVDVKDRVSPPDDGILAVRDQPDMVLTGEDA
jgi:hypothetical protein